LRFSKVNRFRWPLSVAMVCFAGEGLWVAAMPWLRRRNRAGAGERRDA
jgi:hypothetical protein